MQLPATVLIDQPPPADAAPSPVASVKELKHRAEQALQQAQKVQRRCLDAVGAAEQEAEQAEQRLALKQSALSEARHALQEASKAAEDTLQEFHKASRAFQADVAQRATDDPRSPDGKQAPAGSKPNSKPGSRASSLGSKGSKRSQPEEDEATAKVWSDLKARLQAAMASKDAAALRQAADESVCAFAAQIDAERRAEEEEAAAADARANAMGDGNTDGLPPTPPLVVANGGDGGAAPAKKVCTTAGSEALGSSGLAPLSPQQQQQQQQQQSPAVCVCVCVCTFSGGPLPHWG